MPGALTGSSTDRVETPWMSASRITAVSVRPLSRSGGVRGLAPGHAARFEDAREAAALRSFGMRSSTVPARSGIPSNRWRECPHPRRDPDSRCVARAARRPSRPGPRRSGRPPPAPSAARRRSRPSRSRSASAAFPTRPRSVIPSSVIGVLRFSLVSPTRPSPKTPRWPPAPPPARCIAMRKRAGDEATAEPCHQPGGDRFRSQVRAATRPPVSRPETFPLPSSLGYPDA